MLGLLLQPSEDELETVTFTSHRSIKDIQTRVEFNAADELEENCNMKFGDNPIVLNESFGI